MTRRTKEWWNSLGEDKGFVWYFERNVNKGTGSSYLPDDCSECGVCGYPTLGYGPCGFCLDRYLEAIDAATDAR